MAQFQADNSHKAFIITLGGFAATEKASTFVDDLKKEVSKIDVKNYSLIVDSSDLRTFKPEILPVLEKSYALYMSLGFKKILMITPKRVTPRLQLKRIAKKVNFTGEFINSLQAGLELSR
ncbi:MULTISPECIES: hypothetical protein [Heyndrickxia]|uniref:STAS domain-containing protein n=1 Tax=Heyndrickxia faecalis TaxID=2824910 RepID=A0AAU7WIL1_9BACI|nr:hypothetical protein [Heyndrickxia coagulans]AEH54458.1 hypothetical protein BCO26_2400 [Heyndrickxia coagulans 2-6]